MGKLIIFWDDRDAESFGVKDEAAAIKEAKYWIGRRREKSGKTPTQCFYAEKEIDFADILDKIEEAEAKYYTELQEQKDRAEFERLKKKFN